MGMGLYTVDTGYLKRLHDTDSEVAYSSKGYDKKPYVGIIVTNGTYNYFIPLTSAKSKHLKLKNVSKNHYVIYEMVDKSALKGDEIYTEIGTNKVKHILSVLLIAKMIPVPNGKYQKIDFSTITDQAYKRLLIKEYKFLRPLFSDITRKANALYAAQMTSGKVFPFHCNFAELEKICDSESTVSLPH